MDVDVFVQGRKFLALSQNTHFFESGSAGLNKYLFEHGFAGLSARANSARVGPGHKKSPALQHKRPLMFRHMRSSLPQHEGSHFLFNTSDLSC